MQQIASIPHQLSIVFISLIIGNCLYIVITNMQNAHLVPTVLAGEQPVPAGEEGLGTHGMSSIQGQL